MFSFALRIKSKIYESPHSTQRASLFRNERQIVSEKFTRALSLLSQLHTHFLSSFSSPPSTHFPHLLPFNHHCLVPEQLPREYVYIVKKSGCETISLHFIAFALVGSRDSSVGVATGYRLDDQGRAGVRVPLG
jgi:hypothetical protein